ncbi:MAG: 50S ribosomal protein L29 [Candidatus Pacebacteria bacterium]|jgi:ribosomal protein L29|nr:50S ribosomal protein L29 [bacterium]MDP6527304.1 50S ribosomal protein L29 [Candidatus Paceibacterota bacterium]MDP6659418.1 50S ribosomal protein L29 [Candidatus Paceibacterota bacterium]|tara:strand:- start:16449 stop:16634 length:186 start_codon:yes stop_codon:yes gene_type:complete
MAEKTKKSDKDLMKNLSDKRESLRNFRFGITGTKTRNVKEGKNLRKEIARTLTELSSRKNK